MRLCNETVTIVNSQVDSATGYDKYYATIVSGVSWFCEIASSVDSSGLKAADKYTIRIPEGADFGGKTYVNPADYETADPSTAFTLRNGDTIVRGKVKGDSISPAEIHRKYTEAATILGVTDNRRTPNARHWKVVGA